MLSMCVRAWCTCLWDVWLWLRLYFPVLPLCTACNDVMHVKHVTLVWKRFSIFMSSFRLWGKKFLKPNTHIVLLVAGLSTDQVHIVYITVHITAYHSAYHSIPQCISQHTTVHITAYQVHITAYHSAYHSISQCISQHITVHITAYHSAYYSISRCISQCISQHITVHITAYHSAYYRISQHMTSLRYAA